MSTAATSEATETARLLRAYHRHGDIAARKRLIELYLPLVEALAHRFEGRGEEREDLVQVGSIGLIHAIDRFDIERGGELAAYAVPNIAGEIRRHLRDRSAAIRLPRDVADLRGPLAHTRAELSVRLGREPTPVELAAELGVPEERVVRALAAGDAKRTLELSSGATGVDVGDAGEETDSADDRVLLAGAFRHLDERDRRLLYMRFVRDAEPDEVARELGISRRQLSRRTNAALAALRGGLEGPAPAPAERLPEPPSEPKMASMRGTTPRVRDRRLDRSYRIVLARDGDGANAWIARVEDLPGCEATGATADEAAAAAQLAIEEWIERAEAEGREVPEPRATSSHSGRLLLRMPQSLHAELARAAEREEVSLNQFISSVLASAVSWRQNGAAAAPERSRALRVALVANFAVVALAGVVAVVLLIVALSGGL